MSTRDQFKNQKCYIRNLPDELLSAIFDLGSRSAALPSEPSFPMVVSTVSLLWRQIAINKSSLWTSIFVDFFNQKSYSCNVPLFFERSRQQPLYITILFAYPPFTSRSYKDLSEAISRNTGRIREIVVRIKSLSDFDTFASPFNALAFPILSHLEIDAINQRCLTDHVPLFTGAMHLRSMVFPRCPTCAPLGPDLTHLEIRKLTYNPERLRAIFQASPSLHTLTIYKFGGDIWEEPDSLPILASSLRTLNLTIDDSHFSDGTGTCDCPLSHLLTPNLINLKVKVSLAHFLLGQHFTVLPKIEKLKIVGFTLTSEDACVIQQWTTLTHVELLETDHTYLWKASGSSDPWRNLTTITLDNLFVPGETQMVQAIRRSYMQSPRTITVNIGNWDQHCLEQLQSKLPHAVFNLVKLESDPLNLSSGEDYDDEDYDAWSDESGDYYGDGIDDIDYELDAVLDPYSHYYDDDSFDEEEDEEY